MYGICADSRRSVTIARTSSSSVMTVSQHRTNLCQGRSRFRTASARPLEPQLPPHPGEVVGGGAGAALADGHVLHALEERDELGMRGLDARGLARGAPVEGGNRLVDRKSTRLNSSHVAISYAVFCLTKKKRRHSCSSINPPTKKEDKESGMSYM